MIHTRNSTAVVFSHKRIIVMSNATPSTANRSPVKKFQSKRNQ